MTIYVFLVKISISSTKYDKSPLYKMVKSDYLLSEKAAGNKSQGGNINVKSKIKKIAGAAVIAGALLVSVSPAKAETLPGLIWVMDKYTDAFKFDMFIKNGNEKWVYVYTRLSNGKTDVDEVKCEAIIKDRCYVQD